LTRGANDPIVANAIISGEVDFAREASAPIAPRNRASDQQRSSKAASTAVAVKQLVGEAVY